MKHRKIHLLAPGRSLVARVLGRGLLGLTMGFSLLAPASAMMEEKQVAKKPIFVSADRQDEKLIHKIEPKYPPAARRAGIKGKVELGFTIARDGTVRELVIFSGHPLLVKAALDAVQQWRYEPTLEGGKPIEVATRIEIAFGLPKRELDVAYRKLREYKQAIKALREAARVKPEDAGLRVALAIVLDDSGDLNRAITEFRKAIRINPKFFEAHVNLGVALVSKGKFKEAIAVFRKAVEIKPNHGLTHWNLGIVFTRQGRPREALLEFREATRIDPNLIRRILP